MISGTLAVSGQKKERVREEGIVKRRKNVKAQDKVRRKARNERNYEKNAQIGEVKVMEKV